MTDFKRRCWQALKANPAGTVGLALMLLLGLGLWMPSVANWFSVPERNEAVVRSAGPKPASRVDAHLWTRLDRELARPAEIMTVTRNPFRASLDHRPIVGLIAEEPREAAPVVETPDVVEAPAAAPLDITGLTLRSTFLSRKRRGALINGRVLYEGQSFAWQGVTLRVAAVEPQGVTLQSDGESVELRLAKPFTDELFARQ